MFNSMAVYCGSSPGNGGCYLDAARSTGRELARRGIRLVYGGGGVGMMGAVADAALGAGGRVTGVIPAFLSTAELRHPDVADMIVTASMHERKLRMVEEADAFLALPGGFGTLDELFEVLTWAQLGIHHKPAGILNTGGFFDPLLACLDRMTDQGFLLASDRSRLLSAEEPGNLIDGMLSWQPPAESKFALARRVVI